MHCLRFALHLVLPIYLFGFSVCWGQELPGWPLQQGGLSVRIADINGDGLEEVIFVLLNQVHALDHSGVELPGFPSQVFIPGIASMLAEFAIGDTTGDGNKEIFVVSSSGSVVGIDAFGNPLPGWPALLSSNNILKIRLADMNSDGIRDIVFASSNGPPGFTRMHVIDSQLNPLLGWPVDLEGAGRDFVIADLEFDGENELIMSTADLAAGSAAPNPIYVVNQNGEIRDGFPVAPASVGINVLYQIVVGDVDSDGVCEIFGAGGSVLHCLNADGSLFRQPIIVQNQIYYIGMSDVDGDGEPEIVLPSVSAGLQIYDPGSNLVTTSPPSLGNPIFQSVCAADIDGDGASEVFSFAINNQLLESQLHGFAGIDLENLQSFPKSLGAGASMPFRSIAVGDLNNDGALEVFVSGPNQVHAFTLPAPASGIATVDWSQRGGNAANTGFYHEGRIPLPEFIRGDANHDGLVDVADVVKSLTYLFLGDSVVCEASLDFNSDGENDVADAIAQLNYHFLVSGLVISPPFPDCGTEPTPLSAPLGCPLYNCP